MKKVLTYIAVTLLVSSCNYQNAESQDINENLLNETNVINLTKSEFLKRVANYETTPDKWLYLGEKPCVIDFYADWCGPCKILSPIVEELAAQYKGQIYFYKIDVDKERELAAVFGINNIPSILFVPQNEQPQMVRGYIPKNTFINIIKEVIEKQVK